MIRHLIIIDDKDDAGETQMVFSGTRDLAEGWGMDFEERSTDLIGTHSVRKAGVANCLVLIGRPAFKDPTWCYLPTSEDKNKALRQHLIALGVPEDRVIVVGEKSAAELEVLMRDAVAASLSSS